MKLKISFFIIFLIISASSVHAQQATKPGTPADSVKLVKTLQEILFLCRNVDFGDPKTLEIGTFYKVAPYIVYRGEDAGRNWKDTANYRKPVEKGRVDEVCFKINQTVNQDTTYRIFAYVTQTESEGTWHTLLINYKKKGVEKKVIYAFLKIRGKFVLGDIDQL